MRLSLWKLRIKENFTQCSKCYTGSMRHWLVVQKNLAGSTKSPGLKFVFVKQYLGKLFSRWSSIIFENSFRPAAVHWQNYYDICCVWWSGILYAHAKDNSLKCLVPRRCFPIFLLIYIRMYLRAIANPAWLRSARERCIIPFLKDVRSLIGQSYCSDSSSALIDYIKVLRHINTKRVIQCQNRRVN